MSNFKQNLDRFYKAFIDEEKITFFFSGLVDYVSFLRDDQSSQEEYAAQIDIGERSDQTLQKLQEVVVEELDQIFQDIKSRIEKKRIQNETIARLVSEFQAYQKGEQESSEQLEDSLFQILMYLIQVLRKIGEDQLIEDYFECAPDNPKLIGHYFFKSDIDKLRKLRDEFIHDTKPDIWRSFVAIELARYAFRDAHKSLDELESQKGQIFKKRGLSILLEEVKAINRGMKSKLYILLKMNDLKSHATRVNNHFIKKFAAEMVEVEKSTVNLRLSFDPHDGNTTFNGKTAQFGVGTKYRVFLTLLYEHRGEPFYAKDFVKRGNPLLKNQSNPFIGYSDIKATYHHIKTSVKVSRGLDFPIKKEVNKNGEHVWIWPNNKG